VGELTPQAKLRIKELLGDDAQQYIDAVESREGLPPPFKSPVFVAPHVLGWMVDTLGFDPERAAELIRGANATSEGFRLEQEAEREAKRNANAEYQRSYRERNGDDYRDAHREYMRNYRKRHPR
jgi:hypothetical protein